MSSTSTKIARQIQIIKKKQFKIFVCMIYKKITSLNCNLTVAIKLQVEISYALLPKNLSSGPL